MNPIRVFAKLAARVPPFDLQPGAAGSPDVDAATAAALCAGMPERAYRAGLARYAQDESVAQWLGIELWRVAIERAQRDGWRTAGRTIPSRCGNRACLDLIQTLDGMRLASLERALEDTSRRDYPRAVSVIILAETYQPGVWAQADAWQWRAAVLGVGKSAYFDTWKKRVNSVGVVFDGWCNTAFRYVEQRQIGRGRKVAMSG